MTFEIRIATFRYFTNSEYEMAKKCRYSQKQYEIHLILGIGSENVQHYCIDANELIDHAKPEVAWSLPIRKHFKKYLMQKKEGK